MKLKALSFFGAGAIFLGLSGIARADDVAMRPYIGESLNYIFADNSRNSENGLGGTLSGGIPLSQHFNIELGGTYAHFNHDGSPGSEPWREYTQQLGGQYFFSRDPALAPYFGVNVGHSTEVLTQGGKDSTFFTDAGLGAIHYFKVFNTDFGVRASAAYRWTFVDSAKFPGKGVNTFGEPVLSLGLVIPIGIVKKVSEPEEPTVMPIPTPTKPPLKAPPKVDVNRRFDDVHFAFDKSDLDSFARASLDSDAGVINEIAGKYPDVKVDVSGHTDWIGTDAYNQALSERRATAVEKYLTGKGVKESSIQIHAYGESKPVAPNTTKAGRALNRRVEIKTLQ